jgi:putative membrane protein
VEKRQIAVVGLAALGGVFAVLNIDEVDVNWIFGTWQTPLIVVIALSMLIGAGLGILVSRHRGGKT